MTRVTEIRYLIRLSEIFKSWREQASNNREKYRKNKRFKAAFNYWDGFYHASWAAKLEVDKRIEMMKRDFK